MHDSTPKVFSGRARVVVPCGATLGEGPVWDPRSGTLLWVDIKSHHLRRWHPHSQEAEPIHVGEDVGFVVLTPDPDVVLLGLKSGIARLHLAEGGRSDLLISPEPDRPGNRLNDATVAPDGSLVFGSMDNGERERSGAFYRWSPAGLAVFGKPAVITNGPAIFGAEGILYAADTKDRIVYRHVIGPDGVPGPREVFVRFGENDGHPDGLTVDAEGHLWVCHFGAARLTRFAPDGRAVLVVSMPTAQVTKVVFGGDDLRTLFVTSAAHGRDPGTDPLAGHVFALEAGIQGQPPHYCIMGQR